MVSDQKKFGNHWPTVLMLLNSAKRNLQRY